VRSEEICQRKNPVTPSGIEPATFRFVAQNLNHCTTAVPELAMYLTDLLRAGRMNVPACCVARSNLHVKRTWGKGKEILTSQTDALPVAILVS
jgi:hypothetical protein